MAERSKAPDLSVEIVSILVLARDRGFEPHSVQKDFCFFRRCIFSITTMPQLNQNKKNQNFQFFTFSMQGQLLIVYPYILRRGTPVLSVLISRLMSS